jgi:hypothetical protein
MLYCLTVKLDNKGAKDHGCHGNAHTVLIFLYIESTIRLLNFRRNYNIVLSYCFTQNT